LFTYYSVIVSPITFLYPDKSSYLLNFPSPFVSNLLNASAKCYF